MSRPVVVGDLVMLSHGARPDAKTDVSYAVVLFASKTRVTMYTAGGTSMQNVPVSVVKGWVGKRWLRILA